MNAKPPLNLRSSRWHELKPCLAGALSTEDERVFAEAIGTLTRMRAASPPPESSFVFLPCHAFEDPEQSSLTRARIEDAWSLIQSSDPASLSLDTWIALLAETNSRITSSRAGLRDREVMLDAIPLLDPADIRLALGELHGQWTEELARHPIFAAARAYQGLVSIHPFEDGNGRTAHLILNWILSKSGWHWPRWTQLTDYRVTVFAQRLNNCTFADAVNDLIAALQDAVDPEHAAF